MADTSSEARVLRPTPQADGTLLYGHNFTRKERTDLVEMRVEIANTLPIIFVPGVMGSNLRSIGELPVPVWRYDSKAKLGGSKVFMGPGTRQKQLHPNRTEVDDQGDVPSIEVGTMMNPGGTEGLAPGALQLLPTQRYKPGWLSVLDADGKVVQQALPVSDPYKEIYQRKDRWWALIKEEWLSPKEGDPITWDKYLKFLRDAKNFHQQVTPNSYHPNTYAFYGADANGATKSFEQIVWRMKRPAHPSNEPAPTPEAAYDLSAQQADVDGTNPEYVGRKGVFVEVDSMTRQRSTHVISQWELWAGMQDGTGDGTVPAQSGHAPTDSDKVRQVFRLSGVEHEPAFRKSTTAQQVTVYAIGKIAREARVPKTAATTT